MIDSILNSKLSPFMIFVLVILAIILYYFHKPLQEILKNIPLKKQKKQDIKSLKSHDIFPTLQRVKREASFFKFFTHGIYDKTKSRMSSDFVKFKCDVCHEKFTEFLDNDFTNISNDKLKQLILSALWGMHETYIEKIKQHWLSKGISVEDVNYVIELFEVFRHGVVIGFQNRTEAIFACEHYDTHFRKILACYNIYAFGIDLLPRDLQDTFEAINGKFTNIIYN